MLLYLEEADEDDGHVITYKTKTDQQTDKPEYLKEADENDGHVITSQAAHLAIRSQAAHHQLLTNLSRISRASMN